MYAVISAHGGPCEQAISKLHSDAIAVVRQPLTINHVPAGRFIVHGSYHYFVTRLPGMFREYANTVFTDVIGVRPFFFMSTRMVCVCKAYDDDDGKPPSQSATERMVQSHFAHTLTGQT